MNVRAISTAAMLVTGMGFSSIAAAALVDRGGGLIYDTDRNITWLADANYGAGSSFDLADGVSDGAMTWQNAMDWATNLNYYDSIRDITYSDWRLPTTLQPDPSCNNHTGDDSFGGNCSGSEMGHLFYTELGGAWGQSIDTLHNSNYNLFDNIQSYIYWTMTGYVSDTSFAWAFYTQNGGQSADPKYFTYYAWAVRDGDVASASTVPAPAAAWLLGSGLLGMIGFARKK